VERSYQMSLRKWTEYLSAWRSATLYILYAFLALIYAFGKKNYTRANYSKQNLFARFPIPVISFIKNLIPESARLMANKMSPLEIYKFIRQLSKYLNNPRKIRKLINSNRNRNSNVNSLVIRSHTDFSHDGHLGDIVYSLLAMKSIHEAHKKKINYYIKSDVENDSFLKGHPSGGNVMISEGSFRFISPLVLSQNYINKTFYAKQNEISRDVTDLSLFRNGFVNTSSGLITDWYSKAFGIEMNLAIKWLEVRKKHPQYADALIISRSTRYLNQSIDYSFLKYIKKVFFIGSIDEYKIFKKRFKLNNLKFIKVKDALHAAEIINSCKCFVGNQSLFFSIAEGLKVPRALEVYELAPNVVPIGNNCINYIFTIHILKFISKIFDMPTLAIKNKAPNYIHILKNNSPYAPENFK
jgi:hypothetical protein